MEKSNKNSASEDKLGKLHGMISDVYSRRVQAMIDLLEEGVDADVVVDIKAVDAAARWVEKNNIGCAPMQDDAQSGLNKRLQQVRSAQASKVVKFVVNED